MARKTQVEETPVKRRKNETRAERSARMDAWFEEHRAKKAAEAQKRADKKAAGKLKQEAADTRKTTVGPEEVDDLGVIQGVSHQYKVVAAKGKACIAVRRWGGDQIRVHAHPNTGPFGYVPHMDHAAQKGRYSTDSLTEAQYHVMVNHLRQHGAGLKMVVIAPSDVRSSYSGQRFKGEE